MQDVKVVCWKLFSKDGKLRHSILIHAHMTILRAYHRMAFAIGDHAASCE